MKAITIPRLLLLTVLVSACENVPWGSSGDGSGDDATGPSATYERHILFLGAGPELPAAATFDFATIADSARIRRGVRARLATAGRWDSLLDAAWSTTPMREPWRILPQGDLRVVVTDAGDLGALIHGGEPAVRVEAGGLMAETRPDGSTRLVLRRARLATVGAEYPGVVLDAQAGRPLSQNDTVRPVAGIEALLVHGADYHVVVAPAGGDLIAWLSDAGETRIHRGVRLERDTMPEDETDSIAWIVTGGAGLGGRVQEEVADRTPMSAGGLLEPATYVLVSGWIEDGGIRRDVFGLVRDRR